MWSKIKVKWDVSIRNHRNKQRNPDWNLFNRKKMHLSITILLPLPWYTIQMYIRYRIINLLSDFSIVSQIKLPLYVYAYLCTFCFQLFRMFIHYWGHFRSTVICSTASFVFVFYFYHIIKITYIKLKAFKSTLLKFYQWNVHYKQCYKSNKKEKYKIWAKIEI